MIVNLEKEQKSQSLLIKNNMRILLVDDEDLQLIRLYNTCMKVLPDAEYLTYTNPLEALEENSDGSIDIAFLDIEMPRINGIQLAKKLKEINPLIKIIFVTAYSDYALDAFRVHASGYVTKPVSEERIREEIDAINSVVELKPTQKIQVKCFGNFEVFHNGEPLKFSYKKSKEMFAYLIDREGSAININELNAILWEEDHPSYLRNLIVDIQTTLNSVGAKDVFIKRPNECYINVNNVDCDAYEYKKGNPNAIRLYRGEYMIQYSWASFNGE